MSSVNAARDERIGRVLNEHLDLVARGESASEGALLARYPDLADDLRRHLARLQTLRQPGESIANLISRGILEACDEPEYLAQLGAYKIVDYLGRGGMGIVLKAREESLGSTVALKILRPDLAGDAAALARFAREARAAAALRHPHIVTVYAIGQERGVHYIAMEYVPGPSLAQVIRSAKPRSPEDSKRPGSIGVPAGDDVQGSIGVPPANAAAAPDQNPKRQRGADAAPELRTGHPTGETPLPPSSALPSGTSVSPGISAPPPVGLSTEAIREIFRQLLSALAAAHEAGLIHRDVKSANILLDRAEGNQATRQRVARHPGNKATRQQGEITRHQLRGRLL
ncbi:MAG: protein kinase [Planctomycetes bacterium]|nr:protein kinase [Planctomycetota bacterium]